MSDFIWILDAEKSNSFGHSGVSGTYILPKEDLITPPETLAGKRMWVLFRGTEDRLILSLQIKQIEQIIQGYYRQDYVLGVELLTSFRLVANFSEAVKYRSEYTRDLKPGIHQIELATSQEFVHLITQNVQVQLTNPNARSIANLDFDILPRSSDLLAKSAIRLIVSNLNLNQVWAAGTGQKLGAFANFAHALIAKKANQQQLGDAAFQLQALDPLLGLITSETKDMVKTKVSRKRSPKVDAEFTEIQPDNIYTRKFIAAGDTLIDIEAALKKTEHAEQIHQDMLKDIAEYLISKGIVPYESGSIDLMYQSGNKLRVYEIKSATAKNILAQSAKGSFQLACYINELLESYDTPSPFLILQKIGYSELEQYVTQVLKWCAIPVLYYDLEKSWPERVEGLL
jgi:hypothetical protein